MPSLLKHNHLINFASFQRYIFMAGSFINLHKLLTFLALSLAQDRLDGWQLRVQSPTVFSTHRGGAFQRQTYGRRQVDSTDFLGEMLDGRKKQRKSLEVVVESSSLDCASLDHFLLGWFHFLNCSRPVFFPHLSPYRRQEDGLQAKAGS